VTRAEHVDHAKLLATSAGLIGTGLGIMFTGFCVAFYGCYYGRLATCYRYHRKSCE
jgi:hypothetical protein